MKVDRKKLKEGRELTTTTSPLGPKHTRQLRGFTDSVLAGASLARHLRALLKYSVKYTYTFSMAYGEYHESGDGNPKTM